MKQTFQSIRSNHRLCFNSTSVQQMELNPKRIERKYPGLNKNIEICYGLMK